MNETTPETMTAGQLRAFLLRVDDAAPVWVSTAGGPLLPALALATTGIYGGDCITISEAKR